MEYSKEIIAEVQTDNNYLTGLGILLKRTLSKISLHQM